MLRVQGNKRQGDFNRCAALYCLAVTSRQSEPWVRRLVDRAKRMGGDISFFSRSHESGYGAAESLGEALETLILRRNSRAAADAILTLFLDGGAAETVFEGRRLMLQRTPKPLIESLYRLTRGSLSTFMTSRRLSEFRQDMVYELQHDSAFASAMRTHCRQWAKSKSPVLQVGLSFFRKLFVLANVHPDDAK